MRREREALAGAHVTTTCIKCRAVITGRTCAACHPQPVHPYVPLTAEFRKFMELAGLVVKEPPP